MKLEPIATYLEGQTTLVTGQTLFVYSMPDTIRRGVLLRLPLTGTPIDHEIPGRYFTSLQAVIRDNDYTRGETTANTVKDALDLRHVQVGDMFLTYLRPRHLPIPFPRAESDLIEFSVNFDVRFKDTA